MPGRSLAAQIARSGVGRARRIITARAENDGASGAAGPATAGSNPLRDHAPNFSPPEPALTAERAERRQRPRVGPASDGAWVHREQLSDERGREDVGVAVLGFMGEGR